MPNLTPRKDEVRRVLAVLESPDFESGEAMAKEVIREVHSIFEEREWTAIAWRDKPDGTGLSLAWGPFTSATEATRFVKRLDVGGVAQVVTLSSVGMMLSHIAASAKGKAKFCPNCKHPIGTHLHERRIGQCMARHCKCKSMTPRGG